MENAGENVFAPPRAQLDTREGPEALWDLTWKDIRKLYLASVNIRALGVLYAIGAFGVLAVGGVILATPAATTARSGIEALPMALLGVIGVVEIAGAVTSFTRPVWGRWLGVALCVLSLLSFPLGTLIGIIGLIAYAQGGKLFGPDRFMHKDVAEVYKQRKKDKK
jgi:hypothetical protein